MIDGAFVNRNSQSLTYVSYIPPRTWSEEETFGKEVILGWTIKLTSTPTFRTIFNPAEMNNTDTISLVEELRKHHISICIKTLW
jgi:hypothetical protein